jgi:hypothetical protein
VPEKENASRRRTLPRAGNLKKFYCRPPPPLHTAAKKIANLKCIFLKKYLDDFLSKNMLRISKI